MSVDTVDNNNNNSEKKEVSFSWMNIFQVFEDVRIRT